MLESNGEWTRYALLELRGLCLDFFMCVQYDFEASSLQLLFFWFFTLKKFYRFWDSAFVAFEIVQNEWERNKI
jgi:hypothetical protein